MQERKASHPVAPFGVRIITGHLNMKSDTLNFIRMMQRRLPQRNTLREAEDIGRVRGGLDLLQPSHG